MGRGGQLQALHDLAEKRCDVAAISAATLRAATVSKALDTSGLRILARTGQVPLPCWVTSPELDDGLALLIEPTQLLQADAAAQRARADEAEARLGDKNSLAS